MKNWSYKKSLVSAVIMIAVIICVCPVIGIINPTGAGELRSWGEDNTDYSLRYPVIAPIGDYIAVDGAIAIKDDGSLLSFYPTEAPGDYLPVPVGNDFVAVGDGAGHAVAIRGDGSLVSWGRESHGQIADTPTTGSYTQCDAGDGHQIALRDDGVIMCWGRDDLDQCYDTPTTGFFTQITTTTHHSIAIMDDGSLVAWGDDSHGQVGSTPTIGFFIDASCGFRFSVAIQDDDQSGAGNLVSWGDDYALPSGDDFVAVASNMWWSVALRMDGSLVQWGRSRFSPISIGAFPPSGNDHVEIATGFTFGVAMVVGCPVADSTQPDPNVPDVGYGIGNRSLSFVPGNPGEQTALQVTIITLPPPFDIFNDQTMWVGPPTEVSENSGSVRPIAGWPNFWSASLRCAPYYTDWGAYASIHVVGDVIVPDGSYSIRAIDETCDPGFEPNYSIPLIINTSKYGDVDNLTGPPDGSTNITDIVAIQNKFSNQPGAITKSRADVSPSTPNMKVDITDVLYVRDAFLGLPYPFSPPSSPLCP